MWKLPCDNSLSTYKHIKTTEKLRLLLITGKSILKIDQKLEIDALVILNNYNIICVDESWATPMNKQ